MLVIFITHVNPKLSQFNRLTTRFIYKIKTTSAIMSLESPKVLITSNQKDNFTTEENNCSETNENQ